MKYESRILIVLLNMQGRGLRFSLLSLRFSCGVALQSRQTSFMQLNRKEIDIIVCASLRRMLGLFLTIGKSEITSLLCTSLVVIRYFP